MAEHSAGPWEYLAPCRVEPVTGYPITTTIDSFVPVAHVFDDDPNSEANARLVAAAPDLLRVCMDAWADAHSCGGYILPKTGEQMLMAIRKARGEPM